MDLMNFKIDASSSGGTKTIVKARNFSIVIDEPENLGGKDEGPNPVEYILAALAGCYTVVGDLVARELGFKLNGLQMEIDGDLNPARFIGKSFDERAGFLGINVKLHPDADTDKKTLEKWLKTVEDRCPVTDNLTNKTPINISLV